MIAVFFVVALQACKPVLSCHAKKANKYFLSVCTHTLNSISKMIETPITFSLYFFSLLKS
jgi:hypothetical protein